MRTVFWLLTLGVPVWADAQAPPIIPPSSQPSPPATLYVTDGERHYFELGHVLAAVAFAYAPLAQQATPDPDARSAEMPLSRIDALAPQALAARAGARVKAARAVALMHLVGAPPPAITPVARLSTHLEKPLARTGEAARVGAYDTDAGTVLAALDESSLLSRLLNDPHLRAWLKRGADRTGRVWYAEGQWAGVAQVAAALNRPDLLPPLADLATDLRGLRDWLAGRLPETPTPEQAALQAALDRFLQQNAVTAHKSRPLSPTQLSDLGDISRMLQAEILPGQDAPPATAGPPLTGDAKAGT